MSHTAFNTALAASLTLGGHLTCQLQARATPPMPVKEIEPEQIFSWAEGLDHRHGTYLDLPFNAVDLPIAGQACRNLYFKELSAWPDPKGNAVAEVAVVDAVSDYASAEFTEGDKYLQIYKNTLLDGQWPMMNINRHPDRLIKILFLTGHDDEAQHLLNMPINERDGNRWRPDMDDQEILSSLALFEAGRNKTKARDILNRINHMRDHDSWPQWREEWEPAIYYKLGDKDRALELYKNLVREHESNVGDQAGYGVYKLALYNYNIALINQESGRTKAAAEALQKAYSALQNKPAEAPEIKLQLVPFPSSQDIQIASTRLRRKQPLKPMPALLPLSNDENYIQSLIEAKSCFDCVQQGDEAGANEAMNALLQLYQKEAPPAPMPRRPQSLFSSIFNLAASFADKGWNKSAGDAFSRLTVEASKKGMGKYADIFVSFEQIYNDNLQKKPTEREWQSFGKQDKLRQLALFYYYAGKLDRAQLLINRALKYGPDSPDMTKSGASANGTVSIQSLLYLLDAACIAAARDKSTRADELTNKLLLLPASRDEAYGSALAEIASVYEQKSREPAAIALLEKLRLKQELKAYTIPPKTPDQNETPDLSSAKIDFALAQLLYKRAILKRLG